jgi:hypothetical protein
MEDFIYFDKSHQDFTKIKKIIIEQGVNICREIFDSSVIKKSLDNLDYGYIHISPKAQIGQSRRKNKDFIGYSFILCEIDTDFNAIFIKLICARPDLKDGEKLLKLVEEKSLKDGYNIIALHSIIENNLVNWYKKQRFIIKREITFDYNDKKKPKVYLMSKKLT